MYHGETLKNVNKRSQAIRYRLIYTYMCISSLAINAYFYVIILKN